MAERTPELNSTIMRAIRSKNTRPELAVRRALRKLGYGYRLHRRDLPGRPDVALMGRKKVIFVHGCFWHQHANPKCRLSRPPKSRLDYWLPKLERNRLRDRESVEALKDMGWQVLIVWECEISAPEQLEERLSTFINPD